MDAGQIGVAERAFMQMMDWNLSVSADHFPDDPTSHHVYPLS